MTRARPSMAMRSAKAAAAALGIALRWARAFVRRADLEIGRDIIEPAGPLKRGAAMAVGYRSREPTT